MTSVACRDHAPTSTYHRAAHHHAGAVSRCPSRSRRESGMSSIDVMVADRRTGRSRGQAPCAAASSTGGPSRRSWFRCVTSSAKPARCSSILAGPSHRFSTIRDGVARVSFWAGHSFVGSRDRETLGGETPLRNSEKAGHGKKKRRFRDVRSVGIRSTGNRLRRPGAKTGRFQRAPVRLCVRANRTESRSRARLYQCAGNRW